LRESGHYNSGQWPSYLPGAGDDSRIVPSLEQVCFETGMTLCAALVTVLIVQLLLL